MDERTQHEPPDAPDAAPAGDVTRALDRTIAERLGWTVRHSKQSDTYALVNSDNYLFIANALWQMPMYSHNTFETMVKLGERKTEAEAWADCPYFATDLNAAMMLITDLDSAFHLNYAKWIEPDKRWIATLELASMNTRFNGYADTPALAICRAWLAYAAAHAGAGDGAGIDNGGGG